MNLCNGKTLDYSDGAVSMFLYQVRARAHRAMQGRRVQGR